MQPQSPVIHLIVNPTAGRGIAAKQIPFIEARLRSLGCQFKTSMTNSRGHARQLADTAIAAGATTIMSVGGDGTLHEVCNAIIEAQSSKEVSLALAAMGTGNDFARCLGLTGSIDHICEVAVRGKRTYVDVGLIEGVDLPPTYFLVAAGTGYIADTASTVNRGIRYATGMPAYLMGAVQTLFAFKPTIMSLTFDNQLPRTLDVMLISISNVATTGGGMKIAPKASCTDGLFEVCLVRKLNKWVLLQQLPRVIQGLHTGHPAVEMLSARSIRLESVKPLDLWIDGEVLGKTPAIVSMKPSCLPIMLPN